MIKYYQRPKNDLNTASQCTHLRVLFFKDCEQRRHNTFVFRFNRLNHLFKSFPVVTGKLDLVSVHEFLVQINRLFKKSIRAYYMQHIDTLLGS